MYVRVIYCELNLYIGNLGRLVGFCLFGKRGFVEIFQFKDVNNLK